MMMMTMTDTHLFRYTHGRHQNSGTSSQETVDIMHFQNWGMDQR